MIYRCENKRCYHEHTHTHTSEWNFLQTSVSFPYHLACGISTDNNLICNRISWIICCKSSKFSYVCKAHNVIGFRAGLQVARLGLFKPTCVPRASGLSSGGSGVKNTESGACAVKTMGRTTRISAEIMNHLTRWSCVLHLTHFHRRQKFFQYRNEDIIDTSAWTASQLVYIIRHLRGTCVNCLRPQLSMRWGDVLIEICKSWCTSFTLFDQTIGYIYNCMWNRSR